MIIGKYDIPAGSASKPSVGTTAVAGSAPSVDLSPINEKVAALETKVSALEAQLARVQSALSGLDTKFMSKFGDRSEYSYYLGAVYTDFVQSEMYDNGVGFRVSGNATAAVEDKYNLIVKDVGWASVPFNTVQQSSVTLVDSDTDEGTDTLNTSNISIGQTLAAGYLLVDCGATLTNDRCFTTISRSVTYRVQARIGQQIHVSGYMEAETDANGNFILYFSKADEISVSIQFRWTYAFRHSGQLTSGTYRLYIRGTDYTNNRTDCFASSIRSTTVNASGVTVMDGDTGARITKNGVQRTSDGGTTWS
jgi:hypothetical protein